MVLIQLLIPGLLFNLLRFKLLSFEVYHLKAKLRKDMAVLVLTKTAFLKVMRLHKC